MPPTAKWNQAFTAEKVTHQNHNHRKSQGDQKQISIQLQGSSFHLSLMPYSPWHPSSTTCTDSPFRTLSTNFLYSTVTWIQLAHHLNFQIYIAEIPYITVSHYTVHVTMQACTDRINKNSWYYLETQSWRRLRLRPQRQECNNASTHRQNQQKFMVLSWNTVLTPCSVQSDSRSVK